MAERLISQGTSINGISAYEGSFKEGEKGILELHLAFIPPGMDTILDGLDWSLKQAGVKLWANSEVLEGRRVHIYFQKAAWPLALIAGVLAGLFILAILSWKLFKSEAREVAMWVIALIVILAIAAFFVLPRATEFLAATKGLGKGGAG